jgi:preprotein translocase subunit SecE
MKFIDYLRDVRGELHHVSWPTKSQTINYTIIVLVISIATGVFLGILDYVLGLGVQRFL